jgi:hypothetical protein
MGGGIMIFRGNSGKNILIALILSNYSTMIEALSLYYIPENVGRIEISGQIGNS